MSEIVERVARAVMIAGGCGLTRDGERVFCDHCDCHDVARAAIEAMRECTPEMVRSAVVQTGVSHNDIEFGVEAIAGMPPLEPEKQRQGITACAEMRRDWRNLITAALATQRGEG